MSSYGSSVSHRIRHSTRCPQFIDRQKEISSLLQCTSFGRNPRRGAVPYLHPSLLFISNTMKLYENMLVDAFDKSRLIREKYGISSKKFYRRIDRLTANPMLAEKLCMMLECDRKDLAENIEKVWLFEDNTGTQAFNPQKTQRIGDAPHEPRQAMLAVPRTQVDARTAFLDTMKFVKRTPQEIWRRIELALESLRTREIMPEDIQIDRDDFLNRLHAVSDPIVQQAVAEFTPDSNVKKITQDVVDALRSVVDEYLESIDIKDYSRGKLARTLNQYYRIHPGHIEDIHELHTKKN